MEHDPLVLLTRRFARTHARASATGRLPVASTTSLQADRALLREARRAG